MVVLVYTWSESIDPQELYQLVQFSEVVLRLSSNISATTESHRANHHQTLPHHHTYTSHKSHTCSLLAHLLCSDQLQHPVYPDLLDPSMGDGAHIGQVQLLVNAQVKVMGLGVRERGAGHKQTGPMTEMCK